MSRSQVLTLFGCMTLLSACADKADNPFSYTGSSDYDGENLFDSEETDTVEGDDTGGKKTTDDTGGKKKTDDTGEYEVPSGELDEPGDVSGGTPDEDGETEIDLTDISGESNQDQEFYLLLVNTGESDLTYELNFIPSDEIEDEEKKELPPPPAAKATPSYSPSPTRQALRQSIASGQTDVYQPPVGPPSPLSAGDIGETQDDFRVRNNLEDDSEVEYITATLWAVSESVAIWVDNDQPIDWDYDCDGVIDQYASNGNAYGFDNCDLQTVANVVDVNIIPNLTGYFGSVSDVDNNGLVSIVITPIINRLPLESSDEDIQSSFIGSYADPEVDLNERTKGNANSNEQEVIFAFAPDPYGFYNIYTQTTIEEYTDVEVLAQISQSLYRLISYNQHVLVHESDMEEAWVREGLSLLAMDLVGFGAINHNGAWDYLDGTHLLPLTSTQDEGAFSTEDYGAHYLFFRWLTDVAGTDALAGLVQTGDVGVDNIENAMSTYMKSDEGSMSMDEMVLTWQLALLATGAVDEDGDDLVAGTGYAPYSDAEIISAPVTNPAAGDLYGANGYQTGINIRGDNIYVEGGTTDSPTEDNSKQVRLHNSDAFVHPFGQEFYGYVSGGYSAQVVRLTNVPYDETTIEIRASSPDYLPLVVRWNDMETEDYTVELSASATDVSVLGLTDLPTDGSPIYAIGELSAPGYTTTIDDEGTDSVEKVYDTDLWYLDFSDRNGGEEYEVAVWLDRRYGDGTGKVDLEDPWLAIVPSAYVAIPSVTTTTSGSCSEGYVFSYPASMLEHLYYQLFPSGTSFEDAGSESDTADTGSALGDFDPCGEVSEEETTCGDDWDRDDVLDADEPKPASFLEQLQTMQCTLAGGDMTGIIAADSSVFDEDERDSDDVAAFDRRLNLGGNSAEDGEGAFLQTTLTGGGTYLIVVGGGDQTGAYELTVQQVID